MISFDHDASADSTEHLVMACDDQEGADDFARLFSKGAQGAGADRIRLRIDEPVTAHPDQLLADLRRRLQHRQLLPSIIVVDHRFGNEDLYDPESEYLAFATLVGLKHLYEASGAPLPPVVLRSGAERALETLDCHAFVALGGAHIIYKRMTAARQVAILRAALAGEVWSPPDRDPRVRFDGVPWQREILPALEAGFGVQTAAEWLQDQSMHPVPKLGGSLSESCRRAVENARSALGQDPALLHHVRRIDPEWPGLRKGGSARVLALAAAQAGEMWIPLRHLKYRAR